MSRSAADATRFTATSPHAYSKPPTRSSPSNPTIPTSRRGPPINPNHSNPSNPTGETPQQKVARLREARLAAREGQISTWDRVVVRGRIWADIAHRFTVLGLMGASGISRILLPLTTACPHIPRSLIPSPSSPEFYRSNTPFPLQSSPVALPLLLSPT